MEDSGAWLHYSRESGMEIDPCPDRGASGSKGEVEVVEFRFDKVACSAG